MARLSPSRRAACACLAKADDPASLAPVVERRTLSRAANELLIEVKAAAVNPSDVKAATGLMAYAVFPRTPGRDYAGIVIDGPADWIGREVFGSSGDLGIRRDGTHATHLAGGNRSRGGEAAQYLVGGGRRDRRALRHRDGRLSRAPACRSRTTPCW